MAIEKKELDYAGEVGEVGKLLAELVYDLRAKKDMGKVATENLANLMAALNGVDNIDDEVKADRRAAIATMGYHLGEITDAVIGGDHIAVEADEA